jgi:hypothetical protein
MYQPNLIVIMIAPIVDVANLCRRKKHNDDDESEDRSMTDAR